MTAPIPLGDPAPTLFSRIGEENLRRLLWNFYARIMNDAELAPVFESKLGRFPKAAWPMHIMRLEGFWRAVTHGPSQYRGQPGPAHQGLGVGPTHFDRWLALWEQTLGEELPPEEARAMLELARRMRVSLERFALASSQGETA